MDFFVLASLEMSISSFTPKGTYPRMAERFSKISSSSTSIPTMDNVIKRH
jgi:hypothetical protein